MDMNGVAVRRIAVVDDHELYRKGIIGALAGWVVPHTVLEACNGLDYEAQCRETGHLHVALVELRMPQRDGFDTMRWMERHQPRTLALAMCHGPTPAEVQRALQCNARAVLDKGMGAEELYRALGTVLNKGYHVNELVSAELRRKVGAQQAAYRPCERWACLTPREREFVLCYTRVEVNGLHAVAQQLGMAAATAETHRRNVYQKLDLHSRHELMRFVLTNALD